jgi:hypothetical protein
MVATMNRCYEDLAIGDELPEVEQLVTIPVMQRWCSVTETLRRDHYDGKYSIEHDGLPEAVLSGSFSQAYLWGIVFNWVGPDGWILKDLPEAIFRSASPSRPRYASAVASRTPYLSECGSIPAKVTNAATVISRLSVL